MNILISGDIHGRINFLKDLVSLMRVDAVFQVGDLGFYPNYASLDTTSKRHFPRDSAQAEIFDYIDGKKEFPVPLYFVRGNHDDYSLLDPGDSSLPRNFHILQSGIHIIVGLRVGALGGIYYWGHNLDKRKLPKYTQPDEVSSVPSNENVDVLLCHDAPFCRVFEGMHRHGSPYVSRLIASWDPSFLFYGHYDAVVEPYQIGTTQVYPMTTLPEWADSARLLHQKESLFGILRCHGSNVDFSYLKKSLP